MPMTNLDSVMTYHEGLPPIKPHDPFITWSSEITSQPKINITSLPGWLWPPNFSV